MVTVTLFKSFIKQYNRSRRLLICYYDYRKYQILIFPKRVSNNRPENTMEAWIPGPTASRTSVQKCSLSVSVPEPLLYGFLTKFSSYYVRNSSSLLNFLLPPPLKFSCTIMLEAEYQC